MRAFFRKPFPTIRDICLGPKKVNKNWLVHNGTTPQEITGLVQKMMIDLSYSPEKGIVMSQPVGRCVISYWNSPFLRGHPVNLVFYSGFISSVLVGSVAFAFQWETPGVRGTRKQSLEPLPLQGFSGVVAGGKIWLTRMILVDCFLLFSCYSLVVFLVVLCWCFLVFVDCCSMFLICRSSLFMLFFFVWHESSWAEFWTREAQKALLAKKFALALPFGNLSSWIIYRCL